jgi:3-oxoacyl-[acyl-carrier-protein] synthase II
MEPMASKRRVVVTGLGIISPVGLTVNDAWSAIMAGRSGIGPITHFDVSLFPVRFGGSIRDFDITRYIAAKEARKMDPFIHYGLAAAMQAVADAGLEATEETAPLIGVAIGSGIGGLPGIEKGYAGYLEGGPRKISPFFVPSNIINMIAGHVSIHFGFKGPNIAIATACTTGTHNIGEAARMIAYGDAQAMVAGGAEMCTSPCGLGGFCSARALSTRNDDPQTASRPWDKDRDGFVLSDGAGVIVLEEYEFAKKRGARIYAELVGYGMSGDAYHMTSPTEGGEGARMCMDRAMRDARVDPSDVDYINAHGTSTPLGDKAETLAIKSAFGDHARKTMVSSTKSMTGHMIGAAGGVEAIFSVLAIRDQVAPPTINQFTPDPDCDLDYVPNEARQARIDVAVSNSFGFGGTNGSLVFKKLS